MSIKFNFVEELGEKSLMRSLSNRKERSNFRNYFGDEEFEKILKLANQVTSERSASHTVKPRETVFILPGFMGSKLAERDDEDDSFPDLIWVSLSLLKKGGLEKLIWDPTENRIEPAGALHIAYLKMKWTMRLHGFNVRYLPYDWRLTPEMNAKVVTPILKKAGNVSLVCHSQGGRVARWLADQDKDRKLIRRIVTLGTPHHGLYSPVQALGVNLPLLDILSSIDQRRNRYEIVRDIINSLPGLIEMMPLPSIRPGEDFFNFDWWPGNNELPERAELEDAKTAALNLPELDDRAAIIIGTGRKTISGSTRLHNKLEFTSDMEGDGVVAFDLASVKDKPTWYTTARHAFMANDDDVIDGVMDLLQGDSTNALPTDRNDLAPIESRQVPKRVPGGKIGKILESMHES